MATISDTTVGLTAFGLMGFTWRPDPIPTDEAIIVMKRALDLGSNYWNGGEFYGTPEINSLTLLREYFTKYPEDVDKVVINIKGSSALGRSGPDGTEAGIRRSVDACLEMLGGVKKLDIFEMARVDPNVPVEESMKYLGKLVQEGKIGGIALSEVRAETIRRAAKVQRITGGVETEFSLMTPEPITNGIFEACAELNIPVLAYSPLGRGFLTGKLDAENFRNAYNPRASPEALKHNMQRIERIQALAAKKECTPGQLSLAWVKSFNGRPGMPTVIALPGTTSESRLVENMEDIQLTDDDLERINEILASTTIVGDRYPEGLDQFSLG